MVLMDHVSSKGEVSEWDVTKFENHIHIVLIVKMHPIIVQGPNHLKSVQIEGRCSPEWFEVTVSDFIRTYKEWLPLQNLDNCKCTRHMWIFFILIQQASAIRHVAAGSQREESGGVKWHREAGASDGSAIRSKRDCTVRIPGSVAS